MNNQPNNILCSEVDPSKPYEFLKIHIGDEVKVYDRLLHYCSFKTLCYITNDKTFRGTCLNNTELNDLFEAKRKNIEHLKLGKKSFQKSMAQRTTPPKMWGCSFIEKLYNVAHVTKQSDVYGTLTMIFWS